MLDDIPDNFDGQMVRYTPEGVGGGRETIVSFGVALHEDRSNNNSLGNCMCKLLTIWNTHILKDRLTQTKLGKMGAENL